MKDTTVNIFTSCNGVYAHFIPLFIFSHLEHNPDAFVEVCCDGLLPSVKEFALLEQWYGPRFLVRVVGFGYVMVDGRLVNVAPGTDRFLRQPIKKADYVYISDVDIICMQRGIKDIHVKDMERTGLPFSNIVRPKSLNTDNPRLTGLHFTPWENYYPVPDPNNLIDTLKNFDECLLYRLVENRFPGFDTSNTFRPVHGIHASPNREVMGDSKGELSWGIRNWVKEWREFSSSSRFEVFMRYACPALDLVVKKINKAIQ